jgi:hypothetical protein
MRLIDADAIKLYYGGLVHIPYNDFIGIANYFMNQIKEMPTVTPEPHWIPVTERLPEPRIDVWCYSDLGQMVGYYDETVEAWYGRDYLELMVTAWMPLPEPYEGGNDV